MQHEHGDADQQSATAICTTSANSRSRLLVRLVRVVDHAREHLAARLAVVEAEREREQLLAELLLDVDEHAAEHPLDEQILPKCASGSSSTISSAPSRMRGSAPCSLARTASRSGAHPPAPRPAPSASGAARPSHGSRGDPRQREALAALLVRQDHVVEERLEQPGARGAGAGVDGGAARRRARARRRRGARSGRGASRPGRLPGAGAVASALGRGGAPGGGERREVRKDPRRIASPARTPSRISPSAPSAATCSRASR